MKTKILHITPHLGGGVGKVLLNYLIKAKNDPDFEHVLACLDYANENALETARKQKLKIRGDMAKDRPGLLKMAAESDVVLMHWWNHPLLFDFIVRTELPPCRLIIWSHISGFHPPYVFTEKILSYPDKFIFTTPLSFETDEVKNLSAKKKKNLHAIWSTGGVEHVRKVKPEKHSGFSVGYIGTVDFVKIHTDFLNICGKINIPDVKFIVCGGPKEKEFEKEAQALGIGDKFDFKGIVSDITKYLSVFDVFGYPLAPYHYGTCDQVLQESMAAGVVPVVLSNKMESYMVKDKETGLVAKTEEEYVQAVESLYRDEKLRNRLSENARSYAIKTFSLGAVAKEWNETFKEVMKISKSAKKWEMSGRRKEIAAMDVFLESLGKYGKDFKSFRDAKSENEKKEALREIIKLNMLAAWKSETRGTAHHYHFFFPEDPELSELGMEMKKAENERNKD